MNRSISKWGVLADEDLKKIHETAVTLLADTGLKISGESGRSLVLDHGGRETANGHLSLPAPLVEKAIAGNRPFSLYGAGSAGDMDLLSGRSYVHNFGTSAFILDSETGQKRPATLADLIASVKLLDKMDSCHMIHQLVTPTELDAALEQPIGNAVLLLNTAKPVALGASTGREARWAVETVKAAHGGPEGLKRCRAALSYSPISPLIFNEDTMDMLAASANSGVPVLFMSCPMLGVTAPMSMAGGLVLQHMENLGALTLLRLMDPEAKFIYGGRLSVADMRNGLHRDGHPDKGLFGAAATRLAHLVNLPSDVYGASIGGHSSQDIQTGYDKAVNAMPPVMAGADLVSGIGGLSHATLTSFEQIVLDNEIFKMILKVDQGMKVDDDALAAEAIRLMALEDKSFMSQKHTLRHIRSGELYNSPLYAAQQPVYDKWLDGGRQGVFETARQQVRDILADDEPKAANPAVLDALKRNMADLNLEFNGPLQ